MTKATFELTKLTLFDTAKIAKEEDGEKAIFNEDDVSKVLTLVETVDYDKQININKSGITFRDAGHILGSAFIKVEEN